MTAPLGEADQPDTATPASVFTTTLAGRFINVTDADDDVVLLALTRAELQVIAHSEAATFRRHLAAGHEVVASVHLRIVLDLARMLGDRQLGEHICRLWEERQ